MNKESSDYILLKRIKENDKEAFNSFYFKNEPLVYSLLKKYIHKTKDYEELVMCGKYGLILAIKNFDLSYDVMFSTYAVPIILGEIKKYFKNLSIVKVSRKDKDLYRQINFISDELEIKLGRSPTLEEISETLNCPLEDIVEAISSNKSVMYLDEEFDDEVTTKIELVKDDSISIIDQVSLNMALESLSKKERLIIELRYYDGLTQQEVSERLNISQVQVSRIESKTLKTLKELIA